MILMGATMARQRFSLEWERLIGGMSDQGWKDDIGRKYQRIRIKSESLSELVDQLETLGAVTRCSAELLEKLPQAAEWYVALAGYAQKTLNSLGTNPATPFGLDIRPSTFLDSMRTNPSRVSPQRRAAFSKWINSELDELPGLPTDARMCAFHVAMILGARIVGQNQNDGGSLAVDILKQELLQHFGPLKHWTFSEGFQRVWQTVATQPEEAIKQPLWRNELSRTIFDFTPGGSRPDIVATRDGETMLVGEIKGRKDTSNLHESWLPQANAHIDQWEKEFPDAMRAIFGTVIPTAMVHGGNDRKRRGLKEMHELGGLDFVINLSRLADGDDHNVLLFTELFEPLMKPRT